MQLSSIVLDDPETVWLDNKGRSLAYFCKKKPLKINSALVLQLKAIASGQAGKNVRLCLHENSEANFHEMIILERKEKFYRPHKHLSKGESFHMIEGKMAIFIFDNSGQVVDTCFLELGGDFLYRIGIDMYHAVMPLTDLVIYHESKPGPFIGEGDSIFPPWAPDGRCEEEINKYKAKLLDALYGR